MVAKLQEIVNKSREVARQMHRQLEQLADECISRGEQICSRRSRRWELNKVPVRVPVGRSPHRFMRGGGHMRFTSSSCRFSRHFHTSRPCLFSHAYFSTLNLLQLHLSKARFAQRLVARSIVESLDRLLTVPQSHVASHVGKTVMKNLVSDPNVSLQIPGLGHHGTSIPFRQDPAKQAVRTLKEGLSRMALIQLMNPVEPTRRHVGSMNANEAYATECLALAKCEDGGAVVDFNIVSTKWQMPRKSIMDDDILECLKLDLGRYQQELEAVYNDINLIKESFGALYISLEEDGSIIRVHFPNCDVEKCELLLREIGVTRGVVREFNSETTDDSEMEMSASSTSAISAFEQVGEFDYRPDSPQLTMSSLSDDSISEREFFVPILSSASSAPESEPVPEIMMDLLMSGNDGTSGMLYVEEPSL